MYHTIVTLKKGEGRTIKAGGMWIYDNEIDRILGDFENGDLVTVHDFDGYFMGYGFLNMHSRIRVRLMSRKKEHTIDTAFLERRVRDAWEYRKAVCDTGCCRLIFGEADFLPGLVVDKFSDVLVVESLALGIDRLKPSPPRPRCSTRMASLLPPCTPPARIPTDAPVPAPAARNARPVP